MKNRYLFEIAEDIYRKTINLKLARFICNELNINRSTVKQLNSWQLAAD